MRNLVNFLCQISCLSLNEIIYRKSVSESYSEDNLFEHALSVESIIQLLLTLQIPQFKTLHNLILYTSLRFVK